MRSARSRLGPAFVFLGGTAVAAALLAGGERSPRDGLNHYDEQTAVILLVYGLAATVAIAWAAARSPTRAGRIAAGAFALMWGLITAALYFDLMWLVIGPGVAPMPDLCLGGMDCIGETLPGVPITGDGQLVGCLGWLSLPLVGAVVAFSASEGRRSEADRSR